MFLGTHSVDARTRYIVVAVFAVLNVVTGVFCNTAIENAKADKDSSDAAVRKDTMPMKDIAVMKQMQKQRTQVDALRAVFNDIDMNQSKLISLSELKVALEESKMASFLAARLDLLRALLGEESMDISTRDIWTLFMLPARSMDPELYP
ncbi:hypothetical protein AK812_SmicGene11081 [Symbiodinium microadriaticum]|uniref:EF-hand domain-containing protein n=1 Tax=Symbiodinium microadriaticum TaxID=2951 RepID=A0A1Q9EE60_SYMMI|nr:hypothetical protein AK812_SmicGene11081 [Symbiodinium microadriaticum]